jgi:hypothetical protein
VRLEPTAIKGMAAIFESHPVSWELGADEYNAVSMSTNTKLPSCIPFLHFYNLKKGRWPRGSFVAAEQR